MRVRADRNVLGSDHQALGARKISEGLDSGGIVQRHDDRQLVTRELRILRHQSGAGQGFDVASVGGGEDIGAGALFDLESQDLASRKDECDIRAGVRSFEGDLHVPEGVGQ